MPASGIPTIQPPDRFVADVSRSMCRDEMPTATIERRSVPTVLVLAPLGTYIGWNLIPDAVGMTPYAGQQVSLHGRLVAFIPSGTRRRTV